MSQTRVKAAQPPPVPEHLLEPADPAERARWLADDMADSEADGPTFTNDEVFAELRAEIAARRAR